MQKDYRQTIVPALIDDCHARVLLDSGAEVSILDSDFARKIGVIVDTSEQLDCAGVGGAAFQTEGRARIKLTLGGEMVYEFFIWIGRLGSTQAILGTDFMEPAGVRLDLVEGVAQLPDEVRIRFEGRRPLYSDKTEQVRVRSELTLLAGQSKLVRVRHIARKRLWVGRGDRWVVTAIINSRGEPTHVKVTNLSEVPVFVATQTVVGMWLPPGAAPRQLGFVTIGSRKYREWQSLVYEVEPDETFEARRLTHDAARPDLAVPATHRPAYKRPTAILRRNTVSPPVGVDSVADGYEAAVASEPAAEGSVQVLGTSVSARQAWHARAAIDFVASTRLDEALQSASQLEDTVYVHEGGDLSVEDVEGQLAVIPELPQGEEIKIEDIQVALDGGVSNEEAERVRQIIWKRRQYLMGKGNARPPAAAKGVVCDIDVGNAKPVAQRCRRVPQEQVEKLYDLLKALLDAGFIRPSTSPWASPIVIVLKKNGVDIRLCIDYRVVNALTRLMVYPMPIVQELLEDLNAFRWFCSLDMASGFWVVQMTARAMAVSAFVTPFGLFEWLRMPFGLKNAPQIYQRLLDNALYGYLKLTPKHLQEQEADVFVDGQVASAEVRPVIGRRSYIDDILFGGRTWEEMCVKLERLMDACEEWGLSISLPKSQFGMQRVDYLGHAVSAAGIEAKPKNLEELATIPFPGTVKGIQSFLGSLNYYHRFIEHFGVYGAALYEVSQSDLELEKREPGRLVTAKQAFRELQQKLVEAPLLQHADPEKEFVIALYASEWAIAGSIMQEHDGQLLPVKYCSRVLKSHELKFHPAELEVLALLHVLGASAGILSGRDITVLSRRSTMSWLFQAKGLQGRLEKWAVLLSPWSLTIRKSDKGEDGLPGLLAAVAGPREHLDQALESIRPRKRGAASTPHLSPLPTLLPDQEAWVLSFDGSAKPKRASASCGAVLWRLPTWSVEAAQSWHFEEGTVNEAEYRGLIQGLAVAADRGVQELIVCGDSRIVLQQLKGEFECRTPGLQLLLAEAHLAVGRFKRVHLLHVMREYNAAADLITGHALQRGAGKKLEHDEFEDLRRISRLHEVLGSTQETQRSAVFVTTRAARRLAERGGADVGGPTPVAVQAGDDPESGGVGGEDEAHEVDERVSTAPPDVNEQVSRPSLSTSIDVSPPSTITREDAALRSSDDDGTRASAPVSTSRDDATRITSSDDRCRDGADIQPRGDESSRTEGDGTAATRQVWDEGAQETPELQAPAPEVTQHDESATAASPDALQALRAERIEEAQQEETWAARLRLYLRGQVEALTEEQVITCAKQASAYEEVDGLLYYVGMKKVRGGAGKEPHLRLVIPTTLQSELLHHYHRSLNGGHQGVTRTYEKTRFSSYWHGQYQSVRDYVAACPDCQSGKGEPRLRVGSPGNVVATRPFEVLGMDHVPSLPKSARGNTELLIWIDQHTGYLIVSANQSRTAQTVAEAYERCVYRRFGASRVIRHDREPAFMSDVFKAFNRLIGQRSRATLAYRPQANGMTERMVQTVMRAVRLYVADAAQRDWDDHAERLVFALNTAHDRVRQDTPFYLLHGWDPFSTIETNLPLQVGEKKHAQARKWRAELQVKYRQAREVANRLLREAMEARRDAANESARGNDEEIVAGARVWLYVNQVKPGFARKLAHLWHGPFRVLERLEPHLVRLQMEDTDYKMHPVVHVDRLKPWREFEMRPTVELEVPINQRLDFDESLLPEDSLEPGEGDEYEIVAILDHRDDRISPQGRRLREYKVRWLGYDEPDWVGEEDLHAPALLDEYEQRLLIARGRLAAMVTEET